MELSGSAFHVYPKLYGPRAGAELVVRRTKRKSVSAEVAGGKRDPQLDDPEIQ